MNTINRGVRAGVMMLALGVGASTMALEETWLVKGGKPLAEIVIAPQPPRTTVVAAEELQTYVEKITGARLPITNAASRGVPVQVYVGRSPGTDRLKLTDEGLAHGAFRMASGDNWLALLGRDTDFVPPEPRIQGPRETMYAGWDARSGGTYGNPLIGLSRSFNPPTGLWEQDGRGSLNAVHAFLHDLGVRWFFPGEIGEVVSKTDGIAVPRGDRTVVPDFPVRRLMFYGNAFCQATREEVLWQLRLGLTGAHEGSPDGLLGLGAPGHGLHFVIGRPGTLAAHPDYFAIWAGKRVEAPCLSSEGLFQTNLKYARALYDVYGVTRVDLSPTDGYSSLCQCELCKGKSTPERGWDGQLSDYVWGYVDRVARELYKQYPDRKVSCLAYTSYQQPPLKIAQLSPNVEVILCRWRSDFKDPATRDAFRKLTEAWLAKMPSPQLFIWDYYLHARPDGHWRGVPVYFPHIVSDDLKYLKGKSLGEFIEVYRNGPTWTNTWNAIAADHLNIYTTARLYWDAGQDVEALLDDYVTKFYGPARREMKAFIDYAEANWDRATKDVRVIDELGRRVKAAQGAAGAGSVYARRVGMLADYLQPLLDRRDTLAKGREGVPKVAAPRRDPATLKLDGKLDDAFWQGLEDHPLRAVVTGGKPESESSCKIAWAGDSLYIGLTCRDADMAHLNVAATRNEDGNLWLGDSVEFLIETATHAYYQIAVSPSGAICDLDRKKGFNSLWSANATVATAREADRWTVEIRIPAAGDNQEQLDPNNGVAGRMPQQGAPWYFNVCRQRVRGETKERSALATTGTDGFHVPTKFAELTVQ